MSETIDAKNYREIDQLRTEVAGCRDLIATQRTRIAEVEQERDALKAAIWCLDKPDDSTHQETLNMIETLWANKTNPILESLDQSRALAAAEQENARLREGIRALIEPPATQSGINITDGIPSEVYIAIGRERYDDEYEVARDTAESVTNDFKRALTALLAKPEGGPDGN